MAFSTGYTFGFALAICLVCSSALATVSLSLKDIQEANARRDLQKNILEALGLPDDGSTISGEQVDALWNAKVEVVAIGSSDGQQLELAAADLDGSGALTGDDFELARIAVKNTKKAPAFLGLYRRTDNGTVALPMVGKGLWGPISGYIAFDSQLTTVKGATFFAPKETPGLGAEITATPFEAAWLGKTIVEGGNTTPIRVLKSAECNETTNPHCVDGVSGATITSRGVDDMVAASLALYEPYFKTVR